jgi:hypothetical protein
VSWVQHGGEIADHNADGQVDYIRIVDPPYSYNHLVWIDRDYDGYFDDYPGAVATGPSDPQLKVPLFELASKPMQADRPSAAR